MDTRTQSPVTRVAIVLSDEKLAALCAETVRRRLTGVQVACCTPACGTFGLKMAWAEAALCGAEGDGSAPAQTLSRVLLIRPELPVVALIEPDHPDLAQEILRAGAAGVLWRVPGFLEQLPLAILSAACRAESARQAALTRALNDIREENRTLTQLVERLEAVAMTDPLTGLANRRALESRAGELFAASVRYGAELSCLAIDLDGLKVVNDTLGHAAGDELIELAASTIRAGLRRADFASRCGGDEFVALLPQAPAPVACRVAHRLSRTFARGASAIAERLAHARAGATIGLSIGVASRLLGRPTSERMLLEQADAALYAAKRSGKSRVELYGGASGAGLKRAA